MVVIGKTLQTICVSAARTRLYFRHESKPSFRAVLGFADRKLSARQCLWQQS
mgnify:CR=1 FL=1